MKLTLLGKGSLKTLILGYLSQISLRKSLGLEKNLELEVKAIFLKDNFKKISFQLNPLKQEGYELIFLENKLAIKEATLGFFISDAEGL